MATLQTININVFAQPMARRLQTFLLLSQNENGRQIRFRVLGTDIPSGSTATFAGVKPDGNTYSAVCTVDGNYVLLEEALQMTAVAGMWDAKLDIVNGDDNIMTSVIRVVIDADPTVDGVESDSELEGIIALAKHYAEQARSSAYGSPLVATTASAMIDTTKVYVYTGSESGYTAGNWYYYNGSAWVSGGAYNSTGVTTDTTLSESGMAADAKATGEAVSQLNADISEITTESPNLLNFNSDWSISDTAGIDFSADKNSCVITLDGTASVGFGRSIVFGGILASLGLTAGEQITLSAKIVGTLTGTIYVSLHNETGTAFSLKSTAKEGYKTFSYTTAMSNLQLYFNANTVVNAEISIQIEKGSVPTNIHPKGYLFAFDEKARNDIQVLDTRCDSVDTLLTNNARFMPKGYLFQFGINGWQPTECCWVDDELYVFEYSSNDDHTVYSNVYVYDVDFINKTLILDRTLTNNLGHCNTVSYDSFRDYFILGNGGNSSNTEPNEIYLIANAKSKTVLDVNDSDTIRIDVSQLGWGKQLNVCWGDSNRGSRNIAYAMTNYEAGNMDSYYVNNTGSFTGESKRYIRQLLFGFGENHLTYGNYISGRNYNQFNGTFEVLKVYERPFVYHEANNGASFYAGKLYENTVYATNGIHICRHTFSDFGESVETDKILIPLYKADGSPYGVEFEGLDIRKDGLLCSPVSGWIRLYVI